MPARYARIIAEQVAWVRALGIAAWIQARRVRHRTGPGGLWWFLIASNGSFTTKTATARP